MRLGRHVACNQIEIKSPRWKQRVVGIANYRVGMHNEIKILAKDKLQQPYFPNSLYGSGEMIRSCESQTLPEGTKLYLVPISNLEILERV